MAKDFSRLLVPPDRQLEALALAGRDEATSALLGRFNFDNSQFESRCTADGRAPYILRIVSSLMGADDYRSVSSWSITAAHHGYRAGIRLAENLLSDLALPRRKYHEADMLSKEYITASSETYLQSRPTIAGILGELGVRIAPNAYTANTMRICAGLACLQVELFEEEKYLDGAMGELENMVDLSSFENLFTDQTPTD